MQIVNREEFLSRLEATQAGTSNREIFDQSSCFVFKDGWIHTFNDEIACRQKVGLNIDGAVAAVDLMGLQRWPDSEVKVTLNGDRLEIKGKNRRIRVLLEKEILLPYDQVEPPETWTKLPENFSDAAIRAASCTSSNQAEPTLLCVHLTPKWVEACNNYQLVRCKTRLPIEHPMLVRGSSLRQAASLPIEDVSLTRTWVHFRTGAGLIFSCRKYNDSFQDLTEFLKIKGALIQFPRISGEIVNRAEFYLDQGTDETFLDVEITTGRMKMSGQTARVRFEEMTQINYEGARLQFFIPPKIFREVVELESECTVNTNHICIRGQGYTFVTCLGRG